MDTTTSQDTARSLMTLLWRSRQPRPVRPGPRPRISVDDIVTAAIAWADRQGVGSLTMRDLAAELGVKPMTLYSHIPDKATLLALMIDAAMGTHVLDVDAAASWRERILAVVDANLQLFLAHPWLLETWSERPPFGPGVIGKYERELAVLVPIGLPDVQTDAVLTWIVGFVRGAAADLITHRSAPGDNGEWWADVGPLLREYTTPEDYPLATRIGIAAGEALGGAYSADASWRFGLERLLAGLEPLTRGTSGASHQEPADTSASSAATVEAETRAAGDGDE